MSPSLSAGEKRPIWYIEQTTLDRADLVQFLWLVQLVRFGKMGTVISNPAQISRDELFNLAAMDSEFYGRTFFPETYRSPSAQFHAELWQLLESQAYRHVGIEVFRGGAKTTILRTFTSKRIAYGISRTIVYVSEAQDHAIKSLIWIKRKLEHNRLWRETFGLAQGTKWSDEWIEINHSLLGFTISVVAIGITGQTRGINIEDYRPDLIVIDDPEDEENSATPEQRLKIENLIFGSLEKSLAPRATSPDAKMVLLQTPLNQEDVISRCHKDPHWATRKYGCFDANGESRWPEVFPTAELVTAKQAHIDRNQLPLWLREMECTVVGGELSYFKPEWLQFYDLPPDRNQMATFLGVDPVPPPSDKAVSKGLADNDFEALSVIGIHKGRYFLLEYEESRGHTPEWTISKFFYLVDKWLPIKARVESIAYQRVLKWLIEQEMRKRGRFIQIDETEKRPKTIRLKQAFSGIASQRRLFVRRDMHSFISQFSVFPLGSEDGVLDATAMALECAVGSGMALTQEFMDAMQQASEIDVPDLDDWRISVP